MSLKKYYYYLFYKLFKFSEASPSKWLSDWKASLAIDVLELFILVSLIYYFDIPLGNGIPFYLIFIFGISIPNYFIFHHKNQWKNIIIEFDKFSVKKNKIGGVIVWSFIFLIILNLIFSFWYMDIRARRNKTGPYSIEYLNKHLHE